jgi:hypothetical protein
VGPISDPDLVALTPRKKPNSVDKMHLEGYTLGGERMLAALRLGPRMRPGGSGDTTSGRSALAYPDPLMGGRIPLEAKVLAVFVPSRPDPR